MIFVCRKFINDACTCSIQLRHVVHNVIEKNKRRMGRKTEKRERRTRKGREKEETPG